MHWEYKMVWVYCGTLEVPTGKQGLLGGAKKSKKSGWWAYFFEKEPTQPVHESLQQLGDDGWELVAAVVSSATHGGGYNIGQYNPAHWLYFKRPKP